MIQAGNGEIYFCVDGSGSRSRGRFVDIEGSGRATFRGGRSRLASSALLSKKTDLPILEPNGDALTGCWLVATGRAPEKRALLIGEKVEQA
jgi:hypothetical protein